MVEHRTIDITTRGKGLVDITHDVRAIVRAAAVTDAICTVAVLHTSASIVIQENADPDVLSDVADWFEQHVEDGAPQYRHVDEGPDDMSAHIRSTLTATSVSIPVCAGEMLLGTWQGIYLFEHRHGPMHRKLVVSLCS